MNPLATWQSTTRAALTTTNSFMIAPPLSLLLCICFSPYVSLSSVLALLGCLVRWPPHPLSVFFFLQVFHYFIAVGKLIQSDWPATTVTVVSCFIVIFHEDELCLSWYRVRDLVSFFGRVLGTFLWLWHVRVQHRQLISLISLLPQ